MSLSDKIKKALGIVDINVELEKMKTVPGAVLLDVREADEYAHDHIPGSLNLPLSAISQAEKVISDKSTPVFSYCLYGSRSRKAVSELVRMGYTNVRNIGGIASYNGRLDP